MTTEHAEGKARIDHELAGVARRIEELWQVAGHVTGYTEIGGGIARRAGRLRAAAIRQQEGECEGA